MPEEQPFNPPGTLRTPVLFLIYKRPDTTRQVFEAIRQAKPPRLYVAADGPKPDVPGEAEKVQQARDIVLNGVDWDCEIKTLFRDSNLGCKYGVSGGIDWFFDNEEEGIILEDDTLPSKSFFWFCQVMLERYRDENKVFMITGTSYLFNEVESNDAYFFSKYMSIWGWATWKDRWKKYDVNIKNFPQIEQNSTIHSYYNWDEKIRDIFLSNFKKAYENTVDAWGTQWVYTCVVNNGLCLTPYINLVSNIGIKGTRDGSNSPFIGMKRGEVILYDDTKIEITQNFTIDKKLFNNVFYRFKKYSLIKKILKKLRIYNTAKIIYRVFK